MRNIPLSGISYRALAFASLLFCAPAIAADEKPVTSGLALPDTNVLAPPAISQPQPDHADSQPDFPQDTSDLKADPRIIYGKLDNGLRYGVMRNDTPKDTAALRMRIDTGSLNETDAQRGLAHFLEHMAFNGSQNVPEGEMIKRLERLGLSFGADTNASTGFEQTIYQLNLPKTDEEIVDEAFFLMRETASNLTLGGEAIERERGVIASEKRARDSKSFRAFVSRIAFFTEGSGLADRLPIGIDETIATMPRAEFVKYYRGYYHPENTFISFVGDVDTSAAIAKITEYFGDWKADDARRKPITRKPATITPGKVGFHRDDGLSTALTIAALRPYTGEIDSRETRRVRLLRSLGAGMINRRMRRQVEQGTAPYLSAGTSRYVMEDIVDGMVVSIRTAPENWEKSLAAADADMRQALQYGFAQSELDEQIANRRRALQTAIERQNSVPTTQYAERIIAHFDDDRVLTSPSDNLAAFEAAIGAITLADIEAQLRADWQNYDAPAIYLESENDIPDAEAKIKQAFSAARQQTVAAPVYADKQDFRYTEFGDPGAVVQDRYVEEADAHLVKFANNVRLNFKRTDFDEGTIYLRVQVGDGFVSMPGKDDALRRLASNLIDNSGVEGHSRDALATIFAGKRVSSEVRINQDSDAFEIWGVTDRASLADQMNLLTAHVTAPAFTNEADERYRRQLRAWYPTHDASPNGIVRKELPRLVRSGDGRYGYDSLEGLLAPTIGDVRSWAAPQLANGLIEITIVGDVDKATVIEQVARTFGALEKRPDAKGDYPAARMLRFPKGREEAFRYYHRGNDDQAIVRVYWPASDASDPADKYRMSVLRAIFRNRLTEVLREEMGATYSPGAGAFSNDLFAGYGYIFAHVTVEPDQADTVRDAVLQVGGELAKGGIAKDMFDRALQPIVKDLESVLENNAYWNNVLRDAQTGGNGLTNFRLREKTYRGMTLSDINNIAKTSFNRADAISAFVLPKPKAE